MRINCQRFLQHCRIDITLRNFRQLFLTHSFFPIFYRRLITDKATKTNTPLKRKKMNFYCSVKA